MYKLTKHAVNIILMSAYEKKISKTLYTSIKYIVQYSLYSSIKCLPFNLFSTSLNQTV